MGELRTGKMRKHSASCVFTDYFSSQIGYLNPHADLSRKMPTWKRMFFSIGLVLGIPLVLFFLILLLKPQNLFVWPFPFVIFASSKGTYTMLLFMVPFILLMIFLLFLNPKGLPIFIHTYKSTSKKPRCPECGTYLTGWENYCPKCGFNLKEKQERQFS